MLNSIDRSSSQGRRDHNILLPVARLGLPASEDAFLDAPPQPVVPNHKDPEQHRTLAVSGPLVRISVNCNSTPMLPS